MRILFILLAALSFLDSSLGQAPRLIFEKLDHVPGRPSKRISSIKQDRVGFIWFTSSQNQNLHRFDGNEITLFLSSKAGNPVISQSIITPLYTDSKGRLWVKTESGVYLYNDTTQGFAHYKIPAHRRSTHLSTIVQGVVEHPKTGEIYVLTEEGVVYLLQDEQLQPILDIQVNGSKFMTADTSGNLWIAARNILYKYNTVTRLTSQFAPFPNNLLDINEVWDILVDGSYLYIAALKSDLIRFDIRSSKTEILTKNPVNQHYYSLLKDEKGKIWIASTRGLKYLDPVSREITTYLPDDRDAKSISSISPVCLLKDKQGNLWVGTEKGINISYKHRNFLSFNYKEGNFPTDDNVTSILKDSKNQLWVGFGQGGFAILDSNYRLIKHYTSLKGVLPSEELSKVFVFHEDKQGNIWMGTYMHGILKYNHSTGSIKQFYPGKNTSPGIDIRSIASDRDGNLWLAVHGEGIARLDIVNEKLLPIRGYEKESALGQIVRWPFKVMLDKNQNVWVGSNQGAVRLNPENGEFRHYHATASQERGIVSNEVREIMEDSQGRIWVGSTNGLHVIEKGDPKHIAIGNNQLDPYITGIIEDHKGAIWVNTSQILTRMHVKNPEDIDFKTYSLSNGLGIDQISEGANFRTRQGEIFIAGLDGFIKFHPDSIKEDKAPFNIAFTRFELFNQPISVGKHPGKNEGDFYLPVDLNYAEEIVLKEKQNVIRFTFVALSLTYPQSNQYRYLLEGFDKEWIESGTRNTATYTNLRPGNYTLKVKAANSDGIWSENELKLRMKVVPPLWKSKPAVILYIVLIILIMLVIMNLSKQRQKTILEIEQKDSLDRMKTQFFINISHELKTPLTLIMSPVRNLLEENQGTSFARISKEDLQTVYRNVLRLLRIITQVLDLRKIEVRKSQLKLGKHDLLPLLHAVVQSFDFAARARHIELTIHHNFPGGVSQYFDPDKMDKVIFNLVSNAVKFSPDKSPITIRVSPAKWKLNNNKREVNCTRLDFEDLGPGIDKDRVVSIFERFYTSSSYQKQNSTGTGIGLAIVKEFVDMHGGQVMIESPYTNDQGQIIQGTRVSILLPSGEEWVKQENIVQDDNRYREIVQDNLLMIEESNEYSSEGEFDFVENNSSAAYKILFIEDDAELRALVKKEIGKYHDYIEARDGIIGERMAKEIIPDLIISDVMMPGLDGYELVKRLKNDPGTSHVPIILLTAKTSKDDEIEAYASGADAFVRKPFHVKTLLHLVESQIENRHKLKHKFLSSYGVELSQVVPTSTDEKFMEKLLSIIHARIDDPNLGIEDFTREMNMSRTRLYKKVSALANTSVKLLIRKVRLQHATRLLQERNMNVSEVAYAVGFDSLPYFSRCFQEEYGVSPSKYSTREKE
jgi:signal transduction histidine kinase/ligand-binding sensor domain-containing protein/DNA-binding response OmpR family regulator